ncbi:hypothetical protein LQE92_04875 [Lacrimispora sp. NSJ-141]|uniref:Uncharacterized protein n=1 Tax=Lientehia hominis TaxID=2897778 RepID=A0AAP2RGV9_9FIRM|nr:hypothetical protein [Lientehia hominis]MCD2491957.1 hypothetical protein [Lientehia hominis]
MEGYDNSSYQGQDGGQGYQNNPGYQSWQGYQNPAGGQNYTGWNMTPNQRAVKDCGSSPCFLAGVILYSAALLIGLFQSVMGNGSVYVNTAKQAGMIDSGIFSGMAIVLSLILMVPGILICAGMWMFYGSSRGEGVSKTSGLSLAKGGMVANMVVIIIGGALIVVIMAAVAAGIGGADWNGYLYYYFGRRYIEGSEAVMGLVLVLVTLICLAVVGLAVAYLAKAIRTGNVVAHICRTGWPDKKLSMFLIVMNFIVVGADLLSILSGVGGLNRAVNPDLMPILQNALSMGATLCVTISILNLRSRLISGR